MNKIKELQPNEVFVFGSNANGNHTGGAARQAVENFGAIMGQAKGLQGQSYAIVTLDEAMQRVPLAYIGEQLNELNELAKKTPDKRFLLTLVGCGIAGFDIAEIKGECVKITWAPNVVVPFEFRNKTFIKGFDKNLCCRGFQFAVGQEYWLAPNGELELCSGNVFHFCESLQQVHAHYSCANEENRFCEIEALGEIVNDSSKCGARGIRILREIDAEELAILKGLVRGNAGLFNSGDRNSGDRNSGDRNSGYRNSGDRNSGDRNSGDFNSGDFNSGYRNSGDFNSGDRNSGDFNSGYRNSGVFCTRQRNDTITIFDTPSTMTWDDWYSSKAFHLSCGLTLAEWVGAKNMTEEEKAKNPRFEQLGGFWRLYTYHEAWKNLWAALKKEERESFLNLPNFDAKKFEFITGVNVEKDA